MKRRHFILSSSVAVIAGCHRPSAVTDIHQFSMSEALAELQNGKLSSSQLMQHYLQRLEALDRAGPELWSVIELHPEALELAARADVEPTKGPLQGLPILIKDNIETADELLTTAGSLALLEAPRPRQDAEIIRRLRVAGAVIFGKTNGGAKA
jgi:amidase